MPANAGVSSRTCKLFLDVFKGEQAYVLFAAGNEDADDEQDKAQDKQGAEYKIDEKAEVGIVNGSSDVEHNADQQDRGQNADYDPA